MIDIQYAHLSAPLFLGRTNLTEKLDSGRRKDLKMRLCEKTHLLHVKLETPGGKFYALVKGWIAVNMTQETVDQVIPLPPTEKIKAQVSTPHSHVFAGEGHGDAGRGQKQKLKQ